MVLWTLYYAQRVKKSMESKKFLTVKEVAAYFSVKIATVYAWINSGKIGFHKFGGAYRFSEDDIRIFEKRNHSPIQRERPF